MTASEAVLRTLRTWHKLPARQLLERLGISRATLMRAVRELGPQIVARGRARRTAYAARRALRGCLQVLPRYRIEQDGRAHEVATLCPVYPAGGRTFLEVERFDRHGRLGRSPVCSWSALNSALLALPGKPWPEGCAALFKKELVDADCLAAVQQLWLFGQLIANTDMHDGNARISKNFRAICGENASKIRQALSR